MTDKKKYTFDLMIDHLNTIKKMINETEGMEAAAILNNQLKTALKRSTEAYLSGLDDNKK